MKHILFCIYILLATVSAFAQNVERCGQVTAPVGYNYCITQTKGSTNKDVLYYFHGGGGDEKEWNGISQNIYAQWLTNKANPPTVINISFGPYWLLVEQNPSPNSGLLEVFQNIVMPQIEFIATQEPVGERMALGLSMGGFNITQLLGKLPANTFSRSALVCPAIVNLSPWASDAEIQKFAQQNKADLTTLYNSAQIARNFVADETLWHSGVSPFALVENISVSSPSILIATNVDDFTFVSGGNLFAEQVTGLNPAVTFEKWPGGHCALNASGLADFLAN